MSTFCGTTTAGAEVFATDEFLTSPSAWNRPEDAVRYAEQSARVHPHYGVVVAVEITAYGQRDFGPSGRYWLDTGVVGWFSHPGGFRHGDFYNVIPGVGPAPTDRYPRPVRPDYANGA